MVVKPVSTQPISMHVSHPDPSSFRKQRDWEKSLQWELSAGHLTDLLHPMATSMSFQFPETRLIQYDCGEPPNLVLVLVHSIVCSSLSLIPQQSLRSVVVSDLC